MAAAPGEGASLRLLDFELAEMQQHFKTGEMRAFGTGRSGGLAPAAWSSAFVL